MISFDPSRPDFAPYGFTCVRWKPSPMRRPDHHNEIELNLLETGWVTYLLGGRRARVEAGRLSVFWAAIPHQIIEFGPETGYFVATIPFAWFLQCKLPDGFVQPLLRGELHSELPPGGGRADYDRFAQWESDLARPRPEAREIVMLEMKARLLRLAAALPPAAPKAHGSHHALDPEGLSKVEQMACLIAQRYTEPITIAQIGRAVKLHPNYAMGLFRRAFGVTLVDHLTHHRVSHAQRLLVTTEERIVEVAFASGFSSLSRFNEAFFRACRCTPTEYRKHHESAD